MSEKREKWIKLAKRAAFVLLTGIAAALIYFGLDYIVSDDTSSLSRVTIHDFYQEEPIDILFIGTSHTLFALDSQMLTEELDQSVFDLSVVGPDFVKMYYLLNEALRTKEIGHVFVEMSVSRLGIEGKNETGTYLITDYIKGLRNRAELIFNKLDENNYVNAVFPLRRNLTTIPTMATIRETVSRKRQDAYTKYLGWGSYRGRGEWTRQVYRFDNTIDEDLVDEIDVGDIRDDEWEYLMKIMDLCKEKNVELTLYAMPYTDPCIVQYEAYETLNDMVRKEAEKRSAAFLDMNLVRKDIMSFVADDYKDYEHLNLEPGKKVTEFLAEYIRDPNGDWYFDSLSDRFDERKVYGIGFDKTFVSDQGSYDTLEFAKGRVTEVSIRVSPVSVSGERADIRISDGDNGQQGDEWVAFCDYEPVKEEGAVSYFTIPYDDSRQHQYRVSLFAPGTDDLLFQTVTSFGLVPEE